MPSAHPVSSDVCTVGYTWGLGIANAPEMGIALWYWILTSETHTQMSKMVAIILANVKKPRFRLLCQGLEGAARFNFLPSWLPLSDTKGNCV